MGNTLKNGRYSHWAILNLLKKRWKITASSVGICLLLAFLYLLMATPIFESAAEVYVESAGPRIISNIDSFPSESKNFLFTQAAILQSTPIIELALSNPQINALENIASLKDPVKSIRKSLSVDVGAHNDLITITCHWKNAEEAALLANAVAQAYMDYQASRKRGTATDVLKILQTEKDKGESDLNSILSSMLAFKNQNTNILMEEDGVNIELSRLGILSEALTKAELATIEAQSRLDTVKSLQNNPDKIELFLATRQTRGAYIATDPEESQIRAKINEHSMQLSDLMRKSTAESPAVTAKMENIQALRQQLAERQQRIAEACLASAQQEYDESVKKEQSLREAFNRQRVLAQNASVKNTEYGMLETKWERTEKLLGILDSRIKEIDMVGDTGAMHITLLERGLPAEEPSKPNKKMMLAMALFFGLIVGVALSLILEGNASSTPAREISTLLNAPVLGTVPQESNLSRFDDHGMEKDPASASIVNEAYRFLRAAIRFSPAIENAQSILLTSIHYDEGTSNTTCNLAMSLAQSGKKILILDINSNAPVQHKFFRIKSPNGLSNVFSGECRLNECLFESHIQNLSVLPWGSGLESRSDLVRSVKFRELFALLEHRYDCILVDSPAILDAPESLILASAICQKTILVVQPENVKKESLEEAYNGLFSLGKKVDGIILNCVPSQYVTYHDFQKAEVII